MTEQEWAAIIEILNRAPVTLAERQWLQALIDRELARSRAQPGNEVQHGG
jgi:hypothetical protein